MNIILLIIIGLVLFALAIGYHIITQQKERANKILRQKIAKNIAVFDKTEALLANIDTLPKSVTLVECLNQKMLYTLQTLQHLSPKDDSIEKKINRLKSQLIQIENNKQNTESDSFHAPKDDNHALSMLKFAKRLIEVVEKEHKADRLDGESYAKEKARLELVQLKINIENAFRKINQATIKSQYSIAEELVKASLEILHNKTDSYSEKAKERLKASLQKIIANRDDESGKNVVTKSKADDEFFMPKKKW